MRYFTHGRDDLNLLANYKRTRLNNRTLNQP